MNRADKKHIQAWIDGMNQFNSTPDFGTTRIVFTKPEIQNRQYIKGEFKKLGLEVKEDAVGNIYATLKGSDSSLKPVWTGSHIDTVPNAGKFDGMAGVVCGMEAVRLMKESGITNRRDLTIVVYTSEEPTRYRLSCIGSRAMSGDLTLEDTKHIFDLSGRSLYDKLTELNYDLSQFDEIRKYPGDVYASVELHIEQNNRLEKAGLPIGLVNKICAPSNYLVEVTGVQSHAGGTDMEERKDAYAASCEMALALEQIARECPSEFNTATIGCVKVVPDAVNVIPGKCIFTVDIRDCNMDTKQETIRQFTKAFKEIAKKRKVTISIEEKNNDAPLTCDAAILGMLEESCKKFDFPYMNMISGPYHDSLFVGRFAPTAMIFVPSKDGISHSPEEWTEFEEIAQGADVLASTLYKLANQTEELNKA